MVAVYSLAVGILLIVMLPSSSIETRSEFELAQVIAVVDGASPPALKLSAIKERLNWS